jgi:hypothetical protein
MGAVEQRLSNRVLTNFLVPFSVPPEAQVPFTVGCLLLTTSLFTLTYTRNPFLTALRVGLAVPTAYYFWEHGYGPIKMPHAGIEVGVALDAVYGIVRVFESCVVGLWDDYPPVWVRVSDGQRLPLPTTIGGRFAYALDLLTSVRGTSWFNGVVWDWASKGVVYTRPTETSRFRFVMKGLRTLVLLHFFVDCVDTILEMAASNASLSHPITDASLPLYRQCLYAFAVCSMTACAITLSNTYISTIMVAFGSHPSSWPPMFNSPFHATSLQDFWTHRWHALFKRIFERCASCFLVLVPSFAPKQFRRAIRAIVIFALSCLLHLVLLMRPEVTESRPHPSFFDRSALRFFLSQPLGLLFESLVIFPATSRLPETMKLTIRRVWTWGWMLWCGRWFADVWVRRGFFDERLVGFSVVRGLWRGEWFV